MKMSELTKAERGVVKRLSDLHFVWPDSWWLSISGSGVHIMRWGDYGQPEIVATEDIPAKLEEDDELAQLRLLRDRVNNTLVPLNAPEWWGKNLGTVAEEFAIRYARMDQELADANKRAKQLNDSLLAVREIVIRDWKGVDPAEIITEIDKYASRKQNG